MVTKSFEILAGYPTPSGLSKAWERNLRRYRNGQGLPLKPAQVAAKVGMSHADATAYEALAAVEGLEARQGRAREHRRPAWAAALTLAIRDPEVRTSVLNETGASAATLEAWTTGSTRPDEATWEAIATAVPALRNARPPAPLWAQAIAQQRKDLGLSQAALGDRLGWDRTSVAAWEMGRQRPSPQAWAALVKLLPDLAALTPPTRPR
jgi:DNA-binding transcriptional regulator YiaG